MSRAIYYQQKHQSDFATWRKRPVYKVHCQTFAMACDLMEVRLAPGEGLATHADRASALNTFRALKNYRDESANALRNSVARAVRLARADQRQVTLECEV